MQNATVTKRTTCRLCHHSDLALALPMKPSPIADCFVSSEKKSEKQDLFPLDLYQCQTCGHVQNIDVVNPELLFRDYLFETSASAGLVEHFRQYAKNIIKKCELPTHSLVVEMGSNDGTLLRFFKEAQMTVLGVDPAIDIAEKATNSGVKTLPEFFTSELANKIKKEYGTAKLFVANNVYAHSDHLADMTDAIAHLLDNDGVFVFEVSYLLDIVDKFLFDTVYHEHVSYHSIRPFKSFFAAHGLHLYDIERITTKGGSMRCFVQKQGGKRPEQPIVEQMIMEEDRRGLNRLPIFQEYEKAIMKRKADLHKLIQNAQQNKKRIVAYGASTTSITLLYHFELTDKVEYLIDDNVKKQGLYSPGCHLEVKSGDVLYTDKPDVVIILAWQYEQPIIRKHQRFLEQDGCFVVPLIDMKVVDAAMATP